MNGAWETLHGTLKHADFQRFQDYLATSTGLAVITVDYKGMPLTRHSGCNDFCRMLRDSPDYGDRCEKCDSFGGVEAARSKEAFLYLCHANIVDVAVPIIINELYLGAVMAGQVRLENNAESHAVEPVYKMTDLNRVFSQSKAMQEAYQRLPVMTYKKVVATAKIIETICQYMVKSPGEQLMKELTVINEMAASDKPLPANPTEDLIKPALAYIEQHYDKKCTVNALAHRCNISESYFSRLFCKQMGKSVPQYVCHVRVNKAKVLLLNSRSTIGEIAGACGFEDASYFIKVFKRETGVTPAVFRLTMWPGVEED